MEDELKTCSTTDDDDSRRELHDLSADSPIICAHALKTPPQKHRNRSFLLKKKTEVHYHYLANV
jgi:hypothetical protein